MKYRATAAPQASGYSEAGASHKRRALRAFFPNSNSPSSDIHDNADTLRQRSRMLYMSAPVATSAINTNRTKVVGTGLTLKSTIDRDVLGLTPEAAKEWQTKAEAEFRLWAENRRNCDAMGMNNFYGLQQLALKSWLMSGDVFAVVKIRDVDKLHPYALRLHLSRHPGHFCWDSSFFISVRQTSRLSSSVRLRKVRPWLPVTVSAWSRLLSTLSSTHSATARNRGLMASSWSMVMGSRAFSE